MPPRDGQASSGKDTSARRGGDSIDSQMQRQLDRLEERAHCAGVPATPDVAFGNGSLMPCDLSSGADDLVQSFDDLCKFLGRRATQSLADPFDRQRADLADLYP